MTQAAPTLTFGDVTSTPDADTTNDSFLVVVSTRVANIAGNQAGRSAATPRRDLRGS